MCVCVRRGQKYRLDQESFGCGIIDASNRGILIDRDANLPPMSQCIAERFSSADILM